MLRTEDGVHSYNPLPTYWRGINKQNDEHNKYNTAHLPTSSFYTSTTCMFYNKR